MEIYFNREREKYQVYQVSHATGDPVLDPVLFEDADILKAAAFVTNRLREEGTKHEKAVIA